MHCALTGLPNRSFFQDSLHDALQRATAAQDSVAILCIDLDGFKQVNDRFGHPTGDALLVQVAARLSEIVRPTDLAARLGGDEFAILLRSGEQNLAATLASRINTAMARPFDLGPQTKVTIGASVGIKIVDGSKQPPELDIGLAMAQADKALYAAKRAGKGTFRRLEDLAA